MYLKDANGGILYRVRRRGYLGEFNLHKRLRVKSDIGVSIQLGQVEQRTFRQGLPSDPSKGVS